MHRPVLVTACAVLVALSGAAAKAQTDGASEGAGPPLPSVIAFGSCAHQDKPQPILRTVVERQPDLFVYLGDNVYTDTEDMNEQRAIYAQLAAKAEFQNLKANVPLYATWDDHDYGVNDGGKEYPAREGSQKNFRAFWGIGEGHPQGGHDGIYGMHTFTDPERGRTLQLILLDTRSFRDRLRHNPKQLPAGSPFKNDYQPDPDPKKTLLGEAQWAWLEGCLKQKADVRIIASSIQFGHEYNGWESWTNLPREQERMIELLRSTRAAGVMFLSGDVHWGEISKRALAPGYPLYDVTSSGINREWDSVEPNRFRVGPVQREHHFGEIRIDWNAEDPTIALQIVDLKGAVVNRVDVCLSALRFRD